MNRPSRNILVILAGVVICLGLSGLLLLSCGIGGYIIGSRLVLKSSGDYKDPQVGTKAPDFKGTTIYGEEFQLTELSGRPVILNFWATWCTPCIEEIATLQTYSAHYSNEIYVVGINADEPRRDVLEFIEEHDLTFEIVLDPDSRVQSIYSIRGFPSTFVIDRNGIIRAVHLGFLSEERLVEYLDLVGVD